MSPISIAGYSTAGSACHRMRKHGNGVRYRAMEYRERGAEYAREHNAALHIAPLGCWTPHPAKHASPGFRWFIWRKPQMLIWL